MKEQIQVQVSSRQIPAVLRSMRRDELLRLKRALGVPRGKSKEATVCNILDADTPLQVSVKIPAEGR